MHEFSLRRIDYQSERIVPVSYKGIDLETDLRCDFFVNHLIAVEIKSVELLAPVTDFARNDSRMYSPLSLTMGVISFLIVTLF